MPPLLVVWPPASDPTSLFRTCLVHTMEVITSKMYCEYFFCAGLGGGASHQRVFVMSICLVLNAVGSQSVEAPDPAWAHCL